MVRKGKEELAYALSLLPLSANTIHINFGELGTEENAFSCQWNRFQTPPPPPSANIGKPLTAKHTVERKRKGNIKRRDGDS